MTRTRSAKFTVTITLDNAAFELPHYGAEVARILREDLAEAVEHSSADESGSIRDHNGNTVGAWRVSGVGKY